MHPILSLDSIIKGYVISAVQERFQITLAPEDIIISDTPSVTLGHKATSVAFVLGKRLQRPPLEIAVELMQTLKSGVDIEDVQVVKGYLNIFFKPHFLLRLLTSIEQDPKSYIFPDKDVKIHLEYVSANPTGPLHIGHGRWAVLGSSLAAILKRLGYQVFQEFYINDAGNQIQKLKESVEALRNGQPIPEDGYHGEYLRDVLDSSVEPVDFFKQQHKDLLERIGTNMDNYYSEKSLVETHKTEETIEILKEKGLAYLQDGALFFRTTDWGDDKDRAIIKKDGEFTYFAPDISYHYTKVQSGASWIIDILGADHHGYIKRMNAAVQALSNGKVKFTVLLGQFVNLMKNGQPIRMSKRAGDIVSLEEVTDEIGIDALRIVLLSKKFNHAIDFDLDLLSAKNKDNPLFYIQYAHARICSILDSLTDPSETPSLNDWEHPLQLSEPEIRLIMHTFRYKETIEFTAKEMDPYYLYAYVHELASLFHKFYEKVRIREKDHIIFYRVTIIRGVARIFKDAASLLGIGMPSKI